MKTPEGKRTGGAAIKGKGAVVGGSGLQDEKLKPGKMYKASKAVMAFSCFSWNASNYLGKRAKKTLVEAKFWS
jgi:hypothetical protein